MICGVPKEFDYPLLNKLIQGTAGVQMVTNRGFRIQHGTGSLE